MAVGLSRGDGDGAPAPGVVRQGSGTLNVRSPGKVDVPENTIVTTIDSVVNWCRKYSLWPMPFATACCGIELMAVGASRFDIARFGAEVMRFSPRQCDLMIVAGRVAMKMMPVLQRIWLQMPEPKWCISMGACACTGGIFDTYAVVQGVDRFIPVDVYIPGCPPLPEQILRSLMDLQAKVQKGGTLFGKSDIVDRNRGLVMEGRGRKGDARPLQPPGSFWEYNDVRVNRLALALLRLFRRFPAGTGSRGLFRVGPDGAVETLVLEGVGITGARGLTVSTLADSLDRQSLNGTTVFAAHNARDGWVLYRSRPATGSDGKVTFKTEPIAQSLQSPHLI